MITREDLVFATCYQLAAMIASDWENPPGAVTEALEKLGKISEPDGEDHGVAILAKGIPLLQLKSYETEPEVIRNLKRLFALKAVIDLIRIVQHHSDGWNTEHSDKFKKELILRTNNYEDEIKQIIGTKPEYCEIKL